MTFLVMIATVKYKHESFFLYLSEWYLRLALYSKTVMVHVIHKNVIYHLRHLSDRHSAQRI